MADNEIPTHLKFRQNQVFGADQPYQSIQQQDVINSIQFDPTGQLLAIGDNAGRIILFKEEYNQNRSKKTFQYYSQFQSHLPEFDSLKSITMSQSIKEIKWLRHQGRYKKMITSNSNRIKLWKMFEKSETKVILTGQRDTHLSDSHEVAMPQLHKQVNFVSNPQITFPIKHNGNINHIDVIKNEEYLFSTDQDQGILWNFESYNNPFIVQQIKSKKNWKEGQKISTSKFHPISDNMFACGTTHGKIQLNDLRISLNNRSSIGFVAQNDSQKANNYFTEMTKKVSSLQFLTNGRYVAARDYLTVKIWDVCKPTAPVKIIQTNEMLKQKLCSLFQDDCLQDEFRISQLSENLIISGNYDNRFNIIDAGSGHNVEYLMSHEGTYNKKHLNIQKSSFSGKFRSSSKVLACGTDPLKKKIALASLNSFFIYQLQR